MKVKDYPTLYNEFSTCAERNQKKHFQLLKATIILLIAVAILGDIQWIQFTYYAFIPPIIIAVSLLVLFFFTMMSENKKLEKNWFISRAVAENIKQESWLYMMRAKPYHKENEEAKNRFKKTLKQILESEYLPWRDLTHNPEGAQITESMDKQRDTDVEERKQFYSEHRLHDQHRWYSRKAEINNIKEKRLMNLMWVLLSLGVALAFLNAYSGIASIDLPINAVGVATTASAAVLSWVGTRKHKELSQSYKMVAYKLSMIENNARDIKTENQLKEIVVEAEQIMGQEHKYWQIKRLTTIKS